MSIFAENFDKMFQHQSVMDMTISNIGNNKGIIIPAEMLKQYQKEMLIDWYLFIHDD